MIPTLPRLARRNPRVIGSAPVTTAITKVQEIGTFRTTGSTTTSFVIPVTTTVSVGSLVTAAINVSSAVTTSIADSKANTWTIRQVSPSSSRISVAEANITNALGNGDTITFTTASVVHGACFATEWAGVKTTAPLDGTPASGTHTSTTVVAGGAVTTTTNGCLVLGVFGSNNTVTIAIPGGRFTNDGVALTSTTSPRTIAYEWQVQPTAEAITAGGIWSSSTTGGGWTVAYKAA